MKSIPPHALHPNARARVLGLIAEGKQIQAVKLVREMTGWGLKDAKDYTDALKVEAFAIRVPPEVESYAAQLAAQGDRIGAAKYIQQLSGLGLRDAKHYVDALQAGWVRPQQAENPPRGPLSDRVRAFRAAGDHPSAVALVMAETGMSRPEAERFVAALE